VTNLTGTASININGTVGATTASTGAFTTLTTSSTVTLNGGTANGVAYLNGSKVLTSGSFLTFDGTNLGIGTSAPDVRLDVQSVSNGIVARFIGGTTGQTGIIYSDATEIGFYDATGSNYFSLLPGSNVARIVTNGVERARITSTGLEVTGTAAISGGVVTRVNSQTTIASPWAWDSTLYDQQEITALANALTINADAGTPSNGQQTIFRFTDNGTARALTWTTGTSKSFRAVGVLLPTTTIANKTLYVGCVYNSTAARWDVLAVAQEA
jgi:hypothetical protein